MNFGSALAWFGRLAFLALLCGFIFQLYRALHATGGEGAAPRRRRLPAKLLLEDVGDTAEVWLKDGQGEHRRLNPGAKVSLERRLEIGRAPENSLRVVDPYVSSKHCVLHQKGGAFIIMDLGTTNGTRVNDRPLRGQTSLRSGATIEVGRARFRFEVE